MIKSFLFPQNFNERNYSLLLLAVRILFGVLLITHGIQKIENFSVLSAGAFPDPLRMGSHLSLCLAIFGELICSIAFIAGFLYRLSMIPMIVTMLVAFTSVHGGNVSEGELAFIYLVVFILMYLAGPGKYAVDRFIVNKLNAKK